MQRFIWSYNNKTYYIIYDNYLDHQEQQINFITIKQGNRGTTAFWNNNSNLNLNNFNLNMDNYDKNAVLLFLQEYFKFNVDWNYKPQGSFSLKILQKNTENL